MAEVCQATIDDIEEDEAKDSLVDPSEDEYLPNGRKTESLEVQEQVYLREPRQSECYLISENQRKLEMPKNVSPIKSMERKGGERYSQTIDISFWRALLVDIYRWQPSQY